MAQMATIPVFACKRCGKPVYVTHLSSTQDPDASKLKELMKGLADIALCRNCQNEYNYLAAQGRSSEFHLNPLGIIYSVVDKSGLNYYGRKQEK